MFGVGRALPERDSIPFGLLGFWPSIGTLTKKQLRPIIRSDFTVTFCVFCCVLKIIKQENNSV